MKNALMIGAVGFSALAVIAQPAVASRSESASNTPATAATSAVGSLQRKAAEKKYCAMTENTGSRVPTKVCLTEREWKDEGVSITAKSK
jgi:outer membrane protease